MAAPSEKSYATINDSPEAITFSWEVSTTPISFGDTLKPSSTLAIDSSKCDPNILKQIEDKLYGTTTSDPELPTPEWVLSLFEDAPTPEPTYTYTEVDSTSEGYSSKNPSTEGWYELSGVDTYVLSEDTEVDSQKTYYIRSES